MKNDLSSKERLLRCISFEEPDHVPLLLRFFNRSYFMDKSREWHDEFGKADQLLNLGLDDTFHLYPSLPLNQEVKVKKWNISQAEEYPLLIKEYETPKGVLRQVVRQTPDWPRGDDILIFDDFNVPRARTKKYIVENMQDLESLSCLFGEPSGEKLKNFLEYAQRAKRFAKERGLLILGINPIRLGDGAMRLCGVERVAVSTIRNPEFLHRLLEIIHNWDMTIIRLILEIGEVDMIALPAWYESPIFWSPKAYKTFLEPLLREQIELIHKARVKFCYMITREQTPLFDILKQLEVDVLFGPDPVQGEVDMLRMKKEIGDQICLWGGVNSYVTLESGTRKMVRDAVAYAIRNLAPGSGFILSAVDAITGEDHGTRETPLSSLTSLIDTWRELGNYPCRKL